MTSEIKWVLLKPIERRFILILTVPVVLCLFIITLISVFNGKPFAIWLSIIPFTSPVVMMMRVPFMTDPTIDLFISMAVMVVSIFITIWIASKIYRIGILSYGTKPTYKLLFKWIFAKN